MSHGRVEVDVPWAGSLLSGSVAERTTQVLEALTRALLEQPIETIPNPTLVDGLAGLAVAHHALAPTHGRVHAERARALLERAITDVAAGPVGPGLHTGLAGVAWAIDQIAGPPNGDEEDGNAAVDEELVAMLEESILPIGSELLNGVSGILVYGIGRPHSSMARRLCALAVARLFDMSKKIAGGVAWPLSVHDPVWSRAPGGHDLGMAHGQLGPIVALASAASAGIERESAAGAARSGIDWVLAERIGTQYPQFPSVVTSQGERLPCNRLAWCYGELGIACATAVVARALGDDRLLRVAVEIGRNSADCDLAVSGVKDAGLCHGAAGVAHLFHRLFASTHDEKLGEAARRWFGWCLSMYEPDARFGFRALTHFSDGRAARTDDPGLLEGAAGVALALSGALTGLSQCTWDAAFLLSPVVLGS